MPPQAKTNKPDLREMLEDAQREMVEFLLDRMKSKQMTHQELAILQKELNRNGVFIAQDDEDPNEAARRKAAADLPDFDDGDDD